MTKNILTDPFSSYIKYSYNNKYLCIGTHNKKSLITFLVPKNANSTLANIYFKNFHNTFCYEKDTIEEFNWCKFFVENKFVNLDDIQDKIVFVVIRDPLERIISAYKQIGREKHLQFDTYIDIVSNSLDLYFKNDPCVLNNINRHILPQFRQYDLNCIDIFVNINDLDTFLEEYGITFKPKINITTNKINTEQYKYSIDKLKKILKPEYDTYNEIINSEKYYRRK